MLPTFLGIGSAKCGSTWLYKALSGHPEVFVARRKEINYFYKNILWHDLDWYEAHFTQPKNEPLKRIRGEISPFYSKLGRSGVEAIGRLLPNLRIVYIIRNPIDRAWSQASFEFGYLRKQQLDKMSVSTFLRYFERLRTIRYSDYGRTLDIWTSVFGREAIHVDRFDRLQADPRGFLNDIVQHIGASLAWSPSEEILPRKIAETRALVGERGMTAVPPLVKWYLAVQWRESIRRLNDRLDGCLSDWVQEIDELVVYSKPSWRLQRQINRMVLSTPERLAYGVYDLVRNLALSYRYRVVLGDRA